MTGSTTNPFKAEQGFGILETGFQMGPWSANICNDLETSLKRFLECLSGFACSSQAHDPHAYGHLQNTVSGKPCPLFGEESSANSYLFSRLVATDCLVL